MPNMEQLLNGDVRRSRTYTGISGATDRSVATPTLTFSGSFLCDLSYCTDVTSHSGNISQRKSTSGQTASSRDVSVEMILQYL